MPRARRSYGRPGTQVIPADWGTSHAPVITGTFTGTVIIRGLPGEPVMGDDFEYTTPEAPILYGSPPNQTPNARIQVLPAQDKNTQLGGQDVRTAGYLVVINHDAPHIPLLSTVEVTTSSDPLLNLAGRRLVVRDYDMGTIRFERDLYCVDDLTWKPEVVTP